MVQVDEVLYNKTPWDKVEGWDRIVVNVYEDTAFDTLVGRVSQRLWIGKVELLQGCGQVSPH